MCLVLVVRDKFLDYFFQSKTSLASPILIFSFLSVIEGPLWYPGTTLEMGVRVTSILTDNLYHCEAWNTLVLPVVIQSRKKHWPWGSISTRKPSLPEKAMHLFLTSFLTKLVADYIIAHLHLLAWSSDFSFVSSLFTTVRLTYFVFIWPSPARHWSILKN